MLKHIWLCAACFVNGPLLAETVDNVEFQFPPSNYEWRLLVDDTIAENIAPFDNEDEEFETSVDYQWRTPILNNEDENDDQECHPHFKIFTHREGDALEIFVAYHEENPNWGDEDDEIDMLDAIQKNLDESINKLLPNHRFKLNAMSDNGVEGFADWELNDGIQDIMHGYTRAHTERKEGDVKSITLLGYLSTSALTEYNRMIWTEALNQAKVLD